MEPHRVLQETAYPSLAYGLFGLGRFLQQIPDSYKRVIFMSICGSIRLSLDTLVHFLEHAVRDGADVVRTDVDSVQILDERLNIPGTHASGVHRDDLFVNLAERSAMFGHYNRIKRTIPISWNVERQRTELCLEGLFRQAVAFVTCSFFFYRTFISRWSYPV